MVTKRLNVELPFDQYEFLRKEAAAKRLTISALLRQLIEARRGRASEDVRDVYQGDPLFDRRGSFNGPSNLAEEHDRYLYGSNPQ